MQEEVEVRKCKGHWQRYLSSWTRWAVIRAPEAPRGCPIAIAPPLTLHFSWSSPRALATARHCGANASFTCEKQNQAYKDSHLQYADTSLYAMHSGT